jgi:CRISPR-associated protein Csb2
MGASRRLGDSNPARVSSALSGKDASGEPLVGHQHAYFLPLDRDGDGRIDHLLVRCMGGLDRHSQLALSGVRSLWQSKGKPDIQLVPVSFGFASDVLETGRAWTSATPFVSPRHHKASRGAIDVWLEGELRRALQQHGLPAPVRVERVASLRLGVSGRSQRWLEFRRARKAETPQLGYGFRIEFACDVTGPFAVGYGAHFGLGAFAAMT